MKASLNNIEKVKISSLSLIEKENYQKILKKIAKEAGQPVGKHVKNWFNAGEYVLIYKREYDKEPVAFIVFGFFEKHFLIFSSLMIAKSEQGKKISTKLIKKAIKISILNNFLNFKKGNPFIFYILFRTQNPKLYKIISDKIKIFPFPKKFFIPDKSVIDGIRKISKDLWPQAYFNEDTFVLENAYIKTPELIIKPSEIEWSGDKETDKFIDNKIGLSNYSYHALIVVSRFNLFNFLTKK
jgi:hypothetical protein